MKARSLLGFGLAFTVTLTLGCAANPATGVADNGDIFRVRYESGTGTYTSNDVVAQDAIVNSNGEETGMSVQRTEARVHEFKWNDWRYFQGREELDEQDYFRLAGDQAGADEIARARSSASLKMKIGAPVAIIGLAAAMIVNTGVFGTSTAVRLGGGTGGTVVGLTGGLVWYFGRRDMENRHHLSQNRADAVADIIEDCDEGRCSAMRGGHKRVAATPPVTPPRAALPPPPPATPRSPIGRWRGPIEISLTVPGRDTPSSQRSDSTFEIRSKGKKIELVLNTDKPRECPLDGRLEGAHGTLVVGARCAKVDGGNETRLTVRSSAIDATSAGITVHIEFDLVIKPRRGKAITGTATMDASGAPA